MLEDDIRILHGLEITLKSRLLRNSPLPHELIYSDCDYRFLSLGIVDLDMDDPKISYLNDVLLLDEELLPELGIRVGILGHSRSDYDIMLAPAETEETAELKDISPLDSRLLETRKSVPLDKLLEQIHETKKLPSRKVEYELIEDFPVKEIEMSTEKHDNIRENARRRWIRREIKRRNRKLFDTYSIATTLGWTYCLYFIRIGIRLDILT